jgi:NAD(P)H-hydrate epimerase
MPTDFNDLIKYLPEKITSEEMESIDQNSVYMGVPGFLSMENAGASVANYIVNRYGKESKRILVVAGTGNNGGDGFVATRHLLSARHSVKVMIIGKPDDIRTEEAKLNWSILAKLETGISIGYIRDSKEVDELRNELAKSDIAVDAMLGTGVKGFVREPMASVIQILNESKLPIVAVDAPTGLNPTTGEIHGNAIRASATITFHKLKTGLTEKEEYTGEMIVANIGIPADAEIFIGPGDVRRAIGVRRSTINKKDNGYVAIIGGSVLYSGAPAMAGISAIRTGAGLAIVLSPESATFSIKANFPELVVAPLKGDYITESDFSDIEKQLEKADSVVIGPGIGTREETISFLPILIESILKRKLPVVVDADAIGTIPKNLDKSIYTKMIITPNAGEYMHITGKALPQELGDRLERAVELSKSLNCTTVLKGHHTIVTDGTKVKINKAETQALATGGSGDVLSGIIGAMLGLKVRPFDSAVAGTFIHGRSGEASYSEKGFHLTATDLINKLPTILKEFDRGE